MQGQTVVMFKQGHRSLVCGSGGRNKFHMGMGVVNGSGEDMKSDFYGNDESSAEWASVVNAGNSASSPGVT